MIHVFIGYDNKTKVAYHVLSESISKHSSEPVTITPIRLENLKHIFTRKSDTLASTEFLLVDF